MKMNYSQAQLKDAIIMLRRRGASFVEIMYFVHELDETMRSSTVKQWLINAGEWTRHRQRS